MSAVTVQQFISILDEKLAPFSVKMNEIVRSIEFINTKYEELETKLTSYEAKQNDLCNENQALALQLKQTTKELNDLKDVCNDLEQYSRRDCVEIRGVPLKPGLRSGEENTDRIVKKVAATQRRFDKQAAKHHGFECLIPGVASMTLDCRGVNISLSKQIWKHSKDKIVRLQYFVKIACYCCIVAILIMTCAV
jgi:chaperonin cofactor prefoldin